MLIVLIFCLNEDKYKNYLYAYGFFWLICCNFTCNIIGRILLSRAYHCSFVSGTQIPLILLNFTIFEPEQCDSSYINYSRLARHITSTFGNENQLAWKCNTSTSSFAFLCWLLLNLGCDWSSALWKNIKSINLLMNQKQQRMLVST